MRYPLTFFLIAYAFSWLVWVPLALSEDGAGLQGKLRRRKKFEQILSCVPAFLIQVPGSPGISRFSVFYGDVRSNRDADRGRFFFWENVNASVEGERTLAVRIVR